jgi:hypothetical protein
MVNVSASDAIVSKSLRRAAWKTFFYGIISTFIGLLIIYEKSIGNEGFKSNAKYYVILITAVCLMVSISILGDLRYILEQKKPQLAIKLHLLICFSGAAASIIFIKLPIIYFLFGFYCVLASFLIESQAKSSNHSRVFNGNNDVEDGYIDGVVSKRLREIGGVWLLKKNNFISREEKITRDEADIARRIMRDYVYWSNMCIYFGTLLGMILGFYDVSVFVWAPLSITFFILAAYFVFFGKIKI